MQCLLVFMDNTTVQYKKSVNTPILRQIPTQGSLASVKYACLTGTQRKHVQTYILIIFGGLSGMIAFVVPSPSVRRDIFFSKNVKENLKYKDFLTVSGRCEEPTVDGIRL
jgi:hypothetical protein